MKLCCQFLFWIGKFLPGLLRQALLLEKQLTVMNCRVGLVLGLPISPHNDSRAEEQPSISRGVLVEDDGLSCPCRRSGLMAVSAVCFTALSKCSWGSPSVHHAHLVQLKWIFLIGSVDCLPCIMTCIKTYYLRVFIVSLNVNKNDRWPDSVA